MGLIFTIQHALGILHEQKFPMFKGLTFMTLNLNPQP